MDLTALKQRACAAIDADRNALIDLSRRIHANPEVAYCEEKASAWLTEFLAARGFDVERPLADMPTAFRATAEPENGINALEAMIIAYNSINSLRQHMRRSARVHGVITDGGAAPNIVPGHSAASFLVRAEDDEYLEELKTRVVACFEAGAQ